MLLPLLVTFGSVVAAGLEYGALGRVEGLLVSVPLAFTALTTPSQALLVDGTDCNSYCLLHNVALFAYACAELAALWSRGYSVRTLTPFAVAAVATVAVYRDALSGDGFDATTERTKRVLSFCGTLQICGYVSVRAFVATQRGALSCA